MSDESYLAFGDAPFIHTPLVAAFEHVVSKLATPGVCGVLYEETLTAFLFSGLTCSFPLMAEKYGHVGGARKFSWKQFTKAQVANTDSEAASGADLALVLWQSEELARVAVFQAKKSHFNTTRSRYEVDINQVPLEPGERRTQFAMLVATATQFSTFISGAELQHPQDLVVALEDLWPDQTQPLAYDDTLALLIGSIDWIHYLAYRNGEPKALALSHVELDAIEWEFRRTKGQNPVDLSGAIDFLDLLREGVRGGGGWLTLTGDQVRALLPSLIDIAPILVVDESGGAVDLNITGAVVAIDEFDVSAAVSEQNAALTEAILKIRLAEGADAAPDDTESKPTSGAGLLRIRPK